MRVILAPMEGVLDGLVRELLTHINPYDLCVTEFIRVVNTLLPAKTFYRLCPELHNQGYTTAGTPVRVQLLGQAPEWMAENAVRAIELGSHGIDINAGCPAKKVVGSEGGASLLKAPERIYSITREVRRAIPKTSTLSVKVRLGWDNADACFDIADAVEQGGANEIVVHGRTKEDGYRADRINWVAIGDIKSRLSIPVIANGEIRDRNSAKRCLAITQCDGIMVGRGALNLPNLGEVIQSDAAPYRWAQVVVLLHRYAQIPYAHDNGFYHIARLKQWFTYLRHEYPEAKTAFEHIRAMNHVGDILAAITNESQPPEIRLTTNQDR